jgi:DNA-directed RNA polymerase beta' subunit
MTTTEIIEPNTWKFWQEAVTAYVENGYPGGLKLRNEMPNDL